MEQIKSTNIYKGRDGWEAESMSHTDANGQAWQISTHKTRKGVSCSAVQGQDEGGMFSFMMFGSKRLELAHQDGQCNEKKVREVHAAGLKAFEEQMNVAPELIKPAYVLGVGQIVFTDSMHFEEKKRVIFEVIRPGQFRTVTLDGKHIRQEDHIRPYSEKFGIGVYYNEGETMGADEVTALVEAARINETQEREEADRKQKEFEADRLAKIEKGKAIISELPKDAICVIVAESRTDTSDLQSDYHGHRTDNVVYLAFSSHKRDLFAEMRKAADNCNIEEVRKYITPPTVDGNGHERTEENKSWWNPSDEHREKWSMGEGYYLGESKYSGWIIRKTSLRTEGSNYGVTLEVLQIAAAEGRYFVKEQIEATAAPVEVPTDEVQVIEYSEKAIAVIGNTYPIREKLKGAGGRFNKFLTCGAGWIFPKTKLEDLQTLLTA